MTDMNNTFTPTRTWYIPDAPGEFWLGRVVSADRIDKQGARFGHIVGLGRSPYRELTVKVQWEDGSECPIHPDNLTLY